MSALRSIWIATEENAISQIGVIIYGLINIDIKYV